MRAKRPTKYILTLKILIVFLLFSSPPIRPVFGITPMEYFNSLVAGRDDAGFRDGTFSQALFDHPNGLAIDDSGNRLFVADSGNHRIRLVHLDEDSRVETLAGNATLGGTDGPLLQSSFNQPSVLAYLPGDRIVVYEWGGDLRLIDIRNNFVSTLAGNKAETGLSTIWGLGYSTQDDSLYFTEPDEKRLRKMDMKSRKISTVFSDNAQVPRPRAVCVCENKLYVADFDLSEIYQVEPSDNTSTPAALIKAGMGNHVHALAGSSGVLYAAQEGPDPVVRVLPDPHPVKQATAWGFLAENNDPNTEPLMDFSERNSLAGFVVSPKEKRKLFITCPDMFQSIISVKDYDFEKNWNSFTSDDFDYPDEKPVQTFRILVVGDSRVKGAALPTSVDFLGDTLDADIIKWDHASSSWTNTFAKQVEFLLNAKAALSGVRRHFEVLTLSVEGVASGSLINAPALDLVKKKDVDLVLALAASSTYQDYFMYPLTAEGIPGRFDPEYALKPVNSRIPPGVPRHLYDLCMKKNLLRLENNQFVWTIDWDKWDSFDPEIRKDLMELTARPFQVSQTGLQNLITSGGNPRKLIVLYVPWRNWKNESYEHFWRDTCSEEHLNLMDLSDPFYALKTCFYPTAQRLHTHHYLIHGNTLIAYLLSHYLTEQKWVPFNIVK